MLPVSLSQLYPHALEQHQRPAARDEASKASVSVVGQTSSGISAMLLLRSLYHPEAGRVEVLPPQTFILQIRDIVTVTMSEVYKLV